MTDKPINQLECEHCKGRGFVLVEDNYNKTKKEVCAKCGGLGVKEDVIVRN